MGAAEVVVVKEMKVISREVPYSSLLSCSILNRGLKEQDLLQRCDKDKTGTWETRIQFLS